MARLLISAYACEPGKGSEPEVGWQWACQAARFHEVWVITRSNNRIRIEEELQREPCSKLHFVYHDLPSPLQYLKKRGLSIHLYYMIWQFTAGIIARKLNRELRFDIGHHVTFATVRFPSFLAFLGVPYIWGPVGGGELVPRSLADDLPTSSRLRLLSRSLSTWAIRLDPLVLRTARRASLILATTSDTMAVLPSFAHSKTLIIPAIGITVSPGRQRVSENGHEPTSVRVLYAGAVLYTKGIHLALLAFAQVLNEFPGSKLTIAGSGTDTKRAMALCVNLKLDDNVEFLGHIPQHELAVLYRDSDVFVFPSLRDSGGFVVLEAMAAGLPVVCLDLGGPSILINDEVGVKVPPGSSRETANSLATELIELARDPARRVRMGHAATIRVERLFSWDRKGDQVQEFYQKILSS